MMHKIKYILLFVFLPLSLNAQFAKVEKLNVNFDFGLRLQMTELVSEQNSYSSREEVHIAISPFSIYLVTRAKLNNNLSLEFSPGIIFGGDGFTGFEYGFYVKYLFSESKYFLSGGINIHDNIESAHGTENFESTTDESVLLVGFSAGYKMHDNFAFIIGLHKPLSNYFYLHRLISDGKSYLFQDRSLKYLIKAGFEVTF